jgi:hypothetical protein
VIVSGPLSQPGAYPSLPRRKARQQSLGSLDQPLHTPRASNSTASTGASFRTTASSPTPRSTRTTAEDPPLTGRTWVPTPLLMPSPPTGTFDQQTGTEAQGGHFRRVSDPPPSGRLPPLLEVPVNSNIPAPPFSAPSSQFPSVPEKRNQLRPSTAPSLVTPSVPVPLPAAPAPDLERQFSVDSFSSHSTSSTGESTSRRRWPFKSPKRSRTTPNTTPDDASPVVHGDSLPSLPPSIPSSDTLSVHQRPRPAAKPSAPSRAQTTPLKARKDSVGSHISRSGSLLAPLPQSRKWEPLSPAVLEFLEKVASDSDGLLRPAADGSVSAGNLEGLVSRIISGSADKSRDARFMSTFLTVYQLFATSDRLFEVLKRRFASTELGPALLRSRFK